MTFQKGNELARIAARNRKARGVSRLDELRKGRYITRALEDKLNAVHELDGKSKKAIDHILDAMIDEAMKMRNMSVATYIIERIEGKTPQTIDVQHTHDINLDALSEEELLQLRTIVEKAKVGIVDAEFEDVTPKEE